jgi:hypothetical protein
MHVKANKITSLKDLEVNKNNKLITGDDPSKLKLRFRRLREGRQIAPIVRDRTDCNNGYFSNNIQINNHCRQKMVGNSAVPMSEDRLNLIIDPVIHWRRIGNDSSFILNKEHALSQDNKINNFRTERYPLSDIFSHKEPLTTKHFNDLKKLEAMQMNELVPRYGNNNLEQESWGTVKVNRIVNEVAMQPKILSPHNHSLLRAIDLDTIKRYKNESVRHQSYFVPFRNDPNELKGLQNEWKLLNEKLKGNSLLKKIMMDINFFSGNFCI